MNTQTANARFYTEFVEQHATAVSSLSLISVFVCLCQPMMTCDGTACHRPSIFGPSLRAQQRARPACFQSQSIVTEIGVCSWSDARGACRALGARRFLVYCIARSGHHFARYTSREFRPSRALSFHYCTVPTMLCSMHIILFIYGS